MRSKPRLLILGLDGAAYGLMTSWMAAGHLPTFTAFSRDAAIAPLRCTWPPHTAAGWTSLFTGRLPGDHGIFQFWDCQDFDYNLSVTPRGAMGCPILWDVLAEHGWTCGLINIPMSHPPGPWPGYQLTWPLAPTLRYSKPPELLRELSSVGGHALPDIACMYDGSSNYPELAKSYIRARTKAVRHLITNRPTDVVVVVYSEIDRVSHHYWHALDDGHPDHARASAEEKTVIADIYAAIDAAFADILDVISDDCVVMIVSDHGFGPGTRGLRIHKVLAKEGFCVPLNASNLGELNGGVHNDTVDTAGYLRFLDWRRTTVYMPTPGCFGVNVNLKGRQLSGIVDAGDQKTTMAAVTEYLLGLLDPHTGSTVFEAVVPATTAYAGPYTARAPDLLLVPADPALMVLHDLDGPTWDKAGQTGLHRLEGVWIMRAPNVQAEEWGKPMAIEAVAAHLLAALGLPSNAIPMLDETRSANSALFAAGLPDGVWSVARDRTTCWPAYSHSRLGVTPTESLSSNDSTSQSIPETNPEVAERLRAMGYI